MEGKKSVLVRQTVYAVEKFIPTQCPSCRNKFHRNSQDGYLLWTYWIHEPREVREEIRSSIQPTGVGIATELISCGKCHNVTMRALLERRTYENRADAEAALAEGFMNLTTACRVGKERLRGVEVVTCLGPQKGLVRSR